MAKLNKKLSTIGLEKAFQFLQQQQKKQQPKQQWRGNGVIDPYAKSFANINKNYAEDEALMKSNLEQVKNYDTKQVLDTFGYDMKNQYVNYMLEKKNLDNQLAERGVTGGATETAQLGMQALNENRKRLRENEKNERMQAIAKSYMDNLTSYQLSSNASKRADLLAEQERIDTKIANEKNYEISLKNAKLQEKIAKREQQRQAEIDKRAKQEWKTAQFKRATAGLYNTATDYRKAAKKQYKSWKKNKTIEGYAKYLALMDNAAEIQRQNNEQKQRLREINARKRK